MKKRIFLIVLDSLGIGEAKDAFLYNDEGSNTFKSLHDSGYLEIPNLTRLGIYNIDNNSGYLKEKNPIGSYARLQEKSIGKDTILGHWEIAGLVSKKELPVFPKGFPKSFIDEFSTKCNRKVLCNMPYSGTEVIYDFGREHIETGALIVYTSADSVFQIAAHEEIVPLKLLYEYCNIARKLLIGDLAVGRVIARPFVGSYPNFQRTSNRRDYSLAPPTDTMLNLLANNGYEVIGVGKISDIFANSGITSSYKTNSNLDGIDKTIDIIKNKNFEGLCFVNLVDFDMLYGHRNDVKGYALALNEFDLKLPEILSNLLPTDILILTADHGCDPSTASTDHSREDVPMILYSKSLKQNVNLKTRDSFADISATILEHFSIENTLEGLSFLSSIKKGL
ncbi:MAG: phosphopentomutase [Christensenellales bacterium]|jgi:phosphopentomutase